MKYKVKSIIKGQIFYSESVSILGVAHSFASQEITKGASCVLILCDSEGADHADNKGKFFLHQIVK